MIAAASREQQRHLSRTNDHGDRASSGDKERDPRAAVRRGDKLQLAGVLDRDSDRIGGVGDL